MALIAACDPDPGRLLRHQYGPRSAKRSPRSGFPPGQIAELSALRRDECCRAGRAAPSPWRSAWPRILVEHPGHAGRSWPTGTTSRSCSRRFSS
ncbi:MAG: hypothetical protein MZU91_05225 [Desulfosudis oleivorans]|nr:hypothetical protein [Desulfosudis oleivorans]